MRAFAAAELPLQFIIEKRWELSVTAKILTTTSDLLSGQPDPGGSLWTNFTKQTLFVSHHLCGERGVSFKIRLDSL